MPDICNPFFPSLLKCVQMIAERANYDVIAVEHRGRAERERRFLTWSLEGRVDGIVGVFFTLRADDFLLLIAAGVGVVRIEVGPKERGRPADRQYLC